MLYGRAVMTLSATNWVNSIFKTSASATRSYGTFTDQPRLRAEASFLLPSGQRDDDFTFNHGKTALSQRCSKMQLRRLDTTENKTSTSKPRRLQD